MNVFSTDNFTEVAFEENLDTYLYTPFKKTDEGYLVGRAVATNIGVFPYFEDGAVDRQLREPKDVMDFDSLESIKNIPITNNHPTVSVDSSNIKEYEIGNTGSNVRTDGVNVSVDMYIRDAATIELIENGKIALSCGYFTDVIKQEGRKYGGGEYDSKQTNIRYNHLAVVDAGRAGEDARMYVDDANQYNIMKFGTTQTVELESEVINADDNEPQPKETLMAYQKIMVDNKELEVTQESADEILAVVADRDTLKTNNDELTTKVDTLTGQVDSLKDEKKDLEEKLANVDEITPAKIAAAAKDLIGVMTVADKAEVEYDEADDVAAIKQKVVTSVAKDSAHAEAEIEKRGEAYVQARFDTIVEKFAEDEENEDSNAGDVLGGEGDEGDAIKGDAMTARDKYIDGILNKENK